MLANAVTLANPYFQYFKLFPKKEQEIYKNCVQFINKKMEFCRKKVEGIFDIDRIKRIIYANFKRETDENVAAIPTNNKKISQYINSSLNLLIIDLKERYHISELPSSILELIEKFKEENQPVDIETAINIATVRNNIAKLISDIQKKVEAEEQEFIKNMRVCLDKTLLKALGDKTKFAIEDPEIKNFYNNMIEQLLCYRNKRNLEVATDEKIITSLTEYFFNQCQEWALKKQKYLSAKSYMIEVVEKLEKELNTPVGYLNECKVCLEKINTSFSEEQINELVKEFKKVMEKWETFIKKKNILEVMMDKRIEMVQDQANLMEALGLSLKEFNDIDNLEDLMSFDQKVGENIRQISFEEKLAQTKKQLYSRFIDLLSKTSVLEQMKITELYLKILNVINELEKKERGISDLNLITSLTFTDENEDKKLLIKLGIEKEIDEKDVYIKLDDREGKHPGFYIVSSQNEQEVSMKFIGNSLSLKSNIQSVEQQQFDSEYISLKDFLMGSRRIELPVDDMDVMPLITKNMETPYPEWIALYEKDCIYLLYDKRNKSFMTYTKTKGELGLVETKNQSKYEYDRDTIKKQIQQEFFEREKAMLNE